MDRFKPSPIPAIHPVPEYLVQGQTKALYDETKQGLQVPWMGVVTMAMAHYLEFYEVLWRATRPIMESAEAIDALSSLRQKLEARIAELAPPERTATLIDMGYSASEVDGIRSAIEVFSHGNFLYTMMATLARLALEQGDFPATKPATAFTGRHAPEVTTPFVLIEEHHADEQTRAVYASVRKTLGLPFVNTDYRALARWPSYFRMAWDDLAPVTATAEYEQLVTDLHRRFVETAMELPNPTDAVAGDIRSAAECSASLTEVLNVTQLFQWLLPGLIANVAFFRAQLLADT